MRVRVRITHQGGQEHFRQMEVRDVDDAIRKTMAMFNQAHGIEKRLPFVVEVLREVDEPGG